jgi:hypothetical protein
MSRRAAPSVLIVERRSGGSRGRIRQTKIRLS